MQVRETMIWVAVLGACVICCDLLSFVTIHAYISAMTVAIWLKGKSAQSQTPILHGSEACLCSPPHATTMNADDAAELLRRLQALEAEVLRRPAMPEVQAEITRQVQGSVNQMEAIRQALERVGRDRQAVETGILKAKDVMPDEWPGEHSNPQLFSEYAFKLLGWMRRAYDDGGEIM